MAQSSDLKVCIEECETNHLKEFYKCVGQGPLVPKEGPFNFIQFNYNSVSTQKLSRVV